MPSRVTVATVHERLTRIASELDRALAELEVIEEATRQPRRIGAPIRRVLTSEQQKQIRQRLREGESRRSIARSLKLPHATFDYLIRRYKLA